MFRSRRSTLVKRLWKFKVAQDEGQGYTGSGTTAQSPTKQLHSADDDSADMMELKAVAHSMLKRLKEKQLESLVAAVEGKGGEVTPCVPLPQGPVRLGRRMVKPHILCCQVWRWPSLAGASEAESPPTHLRRLPECYLDDPTSVCCNPYHWSRCILPDELPPLYEKALAERLMAEEEKDVSLEQVVSTETGNTPTNLRNSDISTGGTHSRKPFWCTLAYWEQKQRLGRLLPVENPTVNVFQHLPHGDGFCINLLPSVTKNDAVKRTREKIGFGITLSREGDGDGDHSVWLYNRSQHPVFVNSPTLDIPNSRTLIVKRIPPGYCLKVFDYELSVVLERMRDPKLLDGPFDPNTLRISFVKGWGPRYSRQFVTDCHCWLEVLLNVKR